MKNIFSAKISLLLVLFVLLAISFNACKKDSDGSPDVPTGTPVFESITPASGPVSTVLTLKGTGLGQIVSIVFDKNGAPVSFNPNLNTETALIFRVPDTATRGQQNIVLTNADGKVLKVPFDVLPFAVVTSAFPTDFQAGSTVTLTGNNLDVLTKVVIEGTTDEAEVVSSSLNTAVIKMPASEVNSCKLVLSTSAGDKTSDIVFINIDKALPVFTDDLMNGFQSWSWGGVYEPSTDYFITGTKSMKTAFDAGGWGGLQMGNPGSIDASSYRYFTFWAKGADVDFDVQVTINWGPWQSFTIPAGKWTYFKYDLLTAGWTGLDAVNNVTYQIKGADKTFYFDNIVFIK